MTTHQSPTCPACGIDLTPTWHMMNSDACRTIAALRAERDELRAALEALVEWFAPGHHLPALEAARAALTTTRSDR